VKHGRRTVTVLGAAACLSVGGAIGNGLISAGAATTGKRSSTPGSARHGSNEATGHEKSESAAREAAENNGTAIYGLSNSGPGGESNDGPARKSSESGGASRKGRPERPSRARRARARPRPHRPPSWAIGGTRDACARSRALTVLGL
jgi:hypothetical protein